MDPFTSEEVSKLKEFRPRVSDVLYDDYQREDAFLIGWLRARQLNVEKAEEMLRKSMEWRKANNVDSMTLDEIPEKYKQLTPFAYCGLDKTTGCPVYLYLMGRHDYRTMLEDLGPEKVMRFNIIFMEMVAKKMRDLSVDTGKPVTQFIEIIDLEGYSYRQITSKLVRDSTQAMQAMFDANYPEVIRHATMINAPQIFYLMFNFMKPLIPKETLAKIDIQGTDSEKWKQVLASKYPMDLIPPHWGGNLKGSDEFCSQSDIWVFGPLNPKYISDADEDGFTKVKIRAQDKLLINFNIEASAEDSKTLSWEFKVVEHDIGFGVLFMDEQVGKFRRIDTVNDTLHEGILECRKSGKYTVVFDNTYSLVRGKTILHKINIFSNDGLDADVEDFSTTN